MEVLANVRVKRALIMLMGALIASGFGLLP